MKDFLAELSRLLLGSVPTGKEMAVYAKRLFDSLLILVIAFLLVWLAFRVIHFVVNNAERAAKRMKRKIEFDTVESLVRSICKYAIYIIAIIAILRVWGVDTRSLIVGSAILGGAIGFGSQGLIQDIITGLSLLFENQLGVGDWVEIGGKSGVVESIGLRTVRIRDALGQQHIIYNRTIGGVSNYTSGSVALRADVIISSTEIAEELRERLTDMVRELGRDRARFRAPLRIARVGQTESGEVWLRIEGDVVPFQHPSVQADLERGIKRVARSLAVEIPPENITISFAAKQPEGDKPATVVDIRR